MCRPQWELLAVLFDPTSFTGLGLTAMGILSARGFNQRFTMSGRRLCRFMSITALLVIPSVALSENACVHLTATGNAEYPPYLWRDPHNPNRLIGANADLIKHLGTLLGLQIEVIYADAMAELWSATATVRHLTITLRRTCRLRLCLRPARRFKSSPSNAMTL